MYTFCPYAIFQAYNVLTIVIQTEYAQVESWSNYHEDRNIQDIKGQVIGIINNPISCISKAMHFHHNAQVVLLLVYKLDKPTNTKVWLADKC